MGIHISYVLLSSNLFTPFQLKPFQKEEWKKCNWHKLIAVEKPNEIFFEEHVSMRYKLVWENTNYIFFWYNNTYMGAMTHILNTDVHRYTPEEKRENWNTNHMLRYNFCLLLCTFIEVKPFHLHHRKKHQVLCFVL